MINYISFELLSRAEHDGGEKMVLAPRMSKLWLFLYKEMHAKTEKKGIYVFTASSTQLVL